MAGALVCFDRLTAKERAHAYRDANIVVDAVATGPQFKTAGELRTRLDWEIDRFARAMAALDAVGIRLFDFREEKAG